MKKNNFSLLVIVIVAIFSLATLASAYTDENVSFSQVGYAMSPEVSSCAKNATSNETLSSVTIAARTNATNTSKVAADPINASEAGYGYAMSVAGKVISPRVFDFSYGYAQIFKNKLKETVCKRVQINITKRINQFESKKGMHITQYTQLDEKLQNIINRVNEYYGYGYSYSYDYAYGYGYVYQKPTEKLEADLAVLKEKVNDFSVDYIVYAQSIKNAKQFTCAGTEGELKDELSNTRSYLNQVQVDAKAIQDFYKNTIRPDVVTLLTIQSAAVK